MRTAALFAIAVLFSAAARAAEPAPEDWYVPQTYEDKKNVGELYIHGKDKPIDVKLDAEGEIVLDEKTWDIVEGDYRLRTALGAIGIALKNSKQINTIGRNLNSLLIAKGIKISGAGGTYTLRFGDGTQSIRDVIKETNKGEIPATSDQQLPDNRTIEWHTYDEVVKGQTVPTKELALRNVQNAHQDRIDWNSNCGFYVPYVKKGANENEYRLHWAEYGGWDATVFGNKIRPEQSGGDNFMSWLTLKDWGNAAGSKCAHKMSELLTSSKAGMDDERATHYVLTRKLTDNAVALHYVPIGDLIPTGGVGRADECSITASGGEHTNTLSLVGWASAPTAGTLSSLMLAKSEEPDPEGDPEPELVHHVLARQIDDAGRTNLVYLSLGEFWKMSWSTNWNDAVQDIVAEEQVKMGERMTNILYSTMGDPDTIYNRLMALTERAENDADRVHDTFTHITNLTQSAADDANSFYAHITNLTASAGDAAEGTKSTYQHILNIAESAEGESDAIYDRITNLLQKAESVEQEADDTYVHLTNLVKTADNPEAVYHHITNITTQVNYTRITNLIYDTQYEHITNLSYETHYIFITNVIEHMQSFENWTYVTNYLVNYLGVTDEPGSGGGQADAGPHVEPENDPYSGKYVHSEAKDAVLPVKTALMVNDITNTPLRKIKAEHMYDWDVIDTNKYQLVQLRGFDAADASNAPKMPVKRKAADITVPDDEPTWSPEHHSDYGLDWVDYPEELVKITSSDIKKITSWLKERTTVSNILAVVSTNAETLAAMKTNLWTHVQVGTLLDNQSVWTNGAARIEVKGFEQARWGDIPVKEYYGSLGVHEVAWKPQPKPDGDAIYDTATQMGLPTYHRTLERLDDYGLMHATNVWQLYGFEAAEVGQVPAKYEDSIGNVELKWTDPASAIKFVGTDPNNFAVVGVAAKTNTVTFASAANSNVSVGVAGDDEGNVTITIGVYYLTESAVTPPAVE